MKNSKMIQSRLNKILNSWEKRASVRQNTLLPETDFDLEKHDFLPEWLPFFDHPLFDQQSHLHPSLLSLAWLIYNQITLDIENDIVIPLCLSLQNKFENSDTFSTLLTQTVIDESYHVLLTAHASNVTRKKRHLEKLQIPKSYLVTAMRQFQQKQSFDWQKHLVLLVTGIITEVFIGAYLGVVANCHAEHFQPFNRLVTKAHMLDESVHGFVFSLLAYKLVPRLPKEQRDFFFKILPLPLVWFAKSKCIAWQRVLPQVGFHHSKTVLLDCELSAINLIDEPYFYKIERVAKNLGCDNLRERLQKLI